MRRHRRECREPGCRNQGSPDGGRCKRHSQELAARVGRKLLAAATELELERDGRPFVVKVLPDDTRLRRKR